MKKCTIKLATNLEKLAIKPISFTEKASSISGYLNNMDTNVRESLTFYLSSGLENADIFSIQQFYFDGTEDIGDLQKAIEEYGVDFDALTKVRTDGEYTTFDSFVNAFEKIKTISEAPLEVDTSFGGFGDTEGFTGFDGLNNAFVISDSDVVEELKTSVKIKESIDNSSSDLMHKKSILLELTNGIADGSYDNWGIFLNTYFNGMTTTGIKFVKFVEDTILDRLVDFSENGTGFASDVNGVMNDIRKEVYENKIERKKSYQYDQQDENGHIPEDLREQFKLNEGLEMRYFYDVLHNEFDFVLKNVVKIVVRKYDKASIKEIGTSGESEIVSFYDTDMKVELNANKLSEYISLNEDNETTIDYMDIVSDTHDFFNMTDLESNTLYHIVNDDAYYIVDNGDFIDVSPIPIYTVNTRNNRNKGWSGDNDSANTLDQGTAFINNVMSLIKTVKEKNEEFVYGERMGLSEFYELAPHMGEMNADYTSIKNRLTNIAKSNNLRLASIANSLLIHLYGDNATTVGADSIYSLMTKGDDTNNSILNAFSSALLSKRQEKYIESKNGRLIATTTATLENSKFILDDSLSLFLTTRGYTKQSISNKIYVKWNKITLLTTPLDQNSKNVAPVDGDGSKLLEDIVTIQEAQKYMKQLGLSTLSNNLYSYITDTELDVKNIEKKFISLFNKIVLTATANIKTTGRRNRNKRRYTKIKPSESYVAHGDFLHIRPTSVFSAEEIKYIVPMFSPDIMGSVLIGGNKRSATSLPNRNGSVNTQLERYNSTNKKSRLINKFNPFSSDSSIPRAEFKGYYVKTPMTRGTNTLKVSEWGIGMRIEFEMIEGYFKYPARTKEIGKRFLTQPLGYSDKSNPHMADIALNDFNIFSSHTETAEKMSDIYTEYFAQKNEDMQRIMIAELKLFVAGKYHMIKDVINLKKPIDYGTNLDADALFDARLLALSELRDILINNDFSNAKGDMTRLINSKLEIIKIDRDLIKFSDSKLEYKADLISLSGGNHVYLKPHLGVRASKFRVNGNSILENSFEKFKLLLDKEKVDRKEIMKQYKIAKNRNGIKTGLITGQDEVLRRIFIASSVYGHATKVMTMGDESIFPGKYNNKYKSIDDYYDDIDAGNTSGLEEVDGMIKGQNKRAQSNTTSGTRYIQDTTYDGLIEEAATDNIVKYLHIDKNKDGSFNYSFPAFANKSLGELVALGILEKSDGTYFKQLDGQFSFKVNIGDNIITLTEESLSGYNEFEYSVTNAIVTALNTGVSLGETTFIEEMSPDTRNTQHVSFTERLEVSDLEELFNKDSGPIVLPDVVKSMLVTDPTSYINLINQMDVSQDNSDGVQLIHPLLYLIFDYARGKEFGAFHTSNYEALKLLSTSFDYSKYRQQLQKKSDQMPFSFEQMSNLGSMEIWNVFKSMNTAVPFKKPFMEVGGVVQEFKNLHALYMYYLDENIDEQEVWERVLDVLVENPINLNSFVGYITFESAQKNGNYAYNEFNSVFNSEKDDNKTVNLYNTKHEYSYELLSKAHDYDISQNSTISLLTQLVGSLSAGGNSEVESFNIQTSMASLADIHRHSLAKDFSAIAEKFKLENTESPDLYNSIIEGFKSGELTTKGLNKNQVVLFNGVIREGITQMAEMAFNENADSRLIEQIIKDSGLSLDSPAVQKRVLSTLRSGLFKQTIKIKHSGFQAVVTTPHKTAKIFNYRGGRIARGEYIKANLTAKEPDSEASVVTFKGGDYSGIDLMNKYVVPFDYVMVFQEGKRGRLVRSFNVDFSDPSLIIKIVITPDINPDIDKAFESLRDLDLENKSTMVSFVFRGNDSKEASTNQMYIWHLEETYTAEEISTMISNGDISPYVEEKYSLKWYEYINSEGTKIEETNAFKNYHRLMRKGKASKKDISKAKSLLYQTLTERDGYGEPLWSIIPPEVIVPAYMASAFGVDLNIYSLNDIVGTTFIKKNQIANANSFFTINFRRDKKASSFERIKKSDDYSYLLNKYMRAFTREGSVYIEEILDVLNSVVKNVAGDYIINTKHVLDINLIIDKAKENYIKRKAESFVETIMLNASRTPGQSMQSGFNARVVAFLNAQGNSIMAPTSHLVTTGGDFDIDLLNILTTSILQDGTILDGSRFYDGKYFNKKRMLDEFALELNQSNEKIDTYINKINKLIDEKIVVLNSNDTISNEDRLSKETMLTNKYIDEDKARNIRKKFNTSIIKKYDHYLLNAIRDSIQSSFNNIDTAVEVNTAMNFTIMNALVDLASTLNEDGKGDIGDIKQIDFSKYDGESFYYGLISEEEALQGKDGIAVFATTIKMNSTIQGAKVIWDKKYSKLIKNAAIEGNITEIHDIVEGEKATILLYQTNRNKALSILRNEGSIQEFSYKKFKDFSNNPLQIEAMYPKVLIAGEDFIQSKQTLQRLVADTKLDGVTDVIVIKGYEKDGEIINIIIPIDNKDITNITRKSIDINPFEFEHTIKYTKKGVPQTYTRTTFADLTENSIRNQALSSELGKILTSSENIEITSEEKAMLFNSLINVVTKIQNNVDNAKDAVNNTLGVSIKIPKNSNIVDAAIAYFENNETAIKDAYFHMLGKDSTVDTQSQFMSAAVDNAKELILSKIRSNAFTNAIVTTMMILGYSPNVIIEFLHDPEMTVLIEKLKERKSNFESTFINKSLLKLIKGVSISSPYMKSVISLLEVSSEIHKLRSVKGLNENFKTDQFEMDRLRKNVSYNKLYSAIVSDDISKVPLPSFKSSPGKRILNPDMMVFLHTQTAALFVNVFEVENTILPAVSNVVKYLYKIADGQYTDQVYKNINNYISRIQVLMFLNNGKEGVPYTGRILSNDTYSTVPISLNNRAGRSEFVTKFKDYFLSAVENINTLSGEKSKLFSYMSSVNSFNSDFSIINMPILNKSQPDPVELGAVKEAIEELKVLTGDSVLDEANQEMYNNLMIYSLIVNAGKIQKNSMVELFPEISISLSSYLSKLTQKDYDKMLLKSKYVSLLMKGTLQNRVDTLEGIKRRSKNKNASFKEFEEQLNIYEEQEVYGEEELAQQEAQQEAEDEASANLSTEEREAIENNKKKKKNYKIPEIPNPLLINTIYTKDEETLIGVNTSYPSFKIVPVGINEALQVDFVSDISKVASVPEEMIDDLSKIGYTIGMKTEYGTKGRVLAFSGIEEINNKKLEMYLVLDGDIMYKVPGKVIMKDDENIYLSGNTIEQLNSFNIDKRAKIDISISSGLSNNTFDNSITPLTIKGFNLNPSLVDVKIDRASLLLMSQEEKADLMMLDTGKVGVLSYVNLVMDPTYASIMHSSSVDKVTFSTNSKSEKKSKKVEFLIPTIVGKSDGKKIDYKTKRDRNKMFGNILGVLNNMKKGDVRVFLGSDGPGMRGNKKDFKIGGSLIMKKFLEKYFKGVNIETGVHTFPGFILEVNDMMVNSLDLSGFSYKIEKTTDDLKFVTRYNGEDTTIETFLTKGGSIGLKNAKKFSTSFKLGLLEQGILTNIMYKKSKMPYSHRSGGLKNATDVFDIQGKKFIKVFNKVVKNEENVTEIKYYSMIVKDVKDAKVNKKSITISILANEAITKSLDNVKNPINKYCK